MYKYLLHTLLLVYSVSTTGQGIQFENCSSWEEIKAKACQSGKGIFIDVMATWCGPCKEMATYTFPNPELGTLVNGHYISVQVQADQTKRDNGFVRSWYANAQEIVRRYSISAFPTILLLDCNGSLIRKVVGARTASELKQEIQSAMQPENNYTSLLKQYDSGRQDMAFINNLLERSNESTDTVAMLRIINCVVPTVPDDSLFVGEYNRFLTYAGYLAREHRLNFIAIERRYEQMMSLFEQGKRDHGFIRALARFAKYKKHLEKSTEVAAQYISQLDEEGKWSKENLEFIGEFTQASSDMGFHFLLQNAEKINKITRVHFSHDIVNAIIFKEEIEPLLGDSVKNPDWPLIARRVKQYGAFGEEMYLNAKLIHELNNKYWMFLIKTLQIALKKYPFGVTPRILNFAAWGLFEHYEDKRVLKIAASWAKRAVDTESEKGMLHYHLDTYANILYKLGRKRQALDWEQKALALSPGNSELEKTRQKMLNGEPTWPMN